MAAYISLLARQANSVTNSVDGVKTTFSSWDACMSKAYCKWPVIVAIIIASCIVLSVVICIARCLCCGLECCCGIFACCNACCPSPRRTKTKYVDRPNDNFQPAPYQGYQPQSAPAYSPQPYASPPQYSQPYNQPQYAQFDVNNKGHGNEDSLPMMPSYDSARTRRVLDDTHQDDMELGRINHGDEQKAPMLANQAPIGMGRDSHDDTFVSGGATGLPYQQYGARNGGDLGTPYAQPTSYAKPTSYRGTSPALGGRNPSPPQGYGYGPSPIQRQPSYESTKQYSPPLPTQYSPYSPPPQQTYRAFTPQPTHPSALKNSSGPNTPV